MSIRARLGEEKEYSSNNSNSSNPSKRSHHFSSKPTNISVPRPYEPHGRNKRFALKGYFSMSRYHGSNEANIPLTQEIPGKYPRHNERAEASRSGQQRASLDHPRSTQSDSNNTATSPRSSPRMTSSDIGHSEHHTSTRASEDPKPSPHLVPRKPPPPLDPQGPENNVASSQDLGGSTNIDSTPGMDETKHSHQEREDSSRRNQPQDDDFTLIKVPNQTKDLDQPPPDASQGSESSGVPMEIDVPEHNHEAAHVNASNRAPEHAYEETPRDHRTRQRDSERYPEQTRDRDRDRHRERNRERSREKRREIELEKEKTEAYQHAQAKQYKDFEEHRGLLWDEIQTRKQEVYKLQQQTHQYNNDCEKLESEWLQVDKELAKYREMLNASRAFSSREGTIDAQGLLQPFNDLNSSIGDFAYQVLCSVNEEEGGKVVEEDTYILLFKELGGNVSKEMLKVLQPGQLTVMDVIDSLLQYAICTSLYNVIFEDFVPGLSKYQDDVARLDEMYRRMCQVEPQERTARWRAITFNRASALADENFLEDKSKECLRVMETILKTLSPSSILPETCTSALLAIFKAAFAVQKKAKTEYISYDYEVKYVSFRKRFHDTTMEACQGKPRTTPEYVCMTTLFGLVAKKRTMKERNGEWIAHEERSVPVKATVICDNWDPNA